MYVAENEELDQWADQAKSHEETILAIQDFEGILNVTFRHYRQEAIFNSIFNLQFKELKRFREMEKELVVSCSIVYFELNLLIKLEKYQKLKKSSLTLNFFRKIKEVLK